MTTGMPFESKLTSLMYGQSPKKFADFVFSSENQNLIVPGGLMKYDSKNISCIFKTRKNL